MDAKERIMRTFQGKSTDRVPTFCAGIEDRTYNEVLGKPMISTEFCLRNPVTSFLLNHWGPAFSKTLLQPVLNVGLDKRIRAAIELGFDATWGLYEESFILLSADKMVRHSGGVFKMLEDGYGNVGYQYCEPGIKTREDFESFSYWPDADAIAHRVYKFYRKMLRKYGDQICIFGQGSAYGIHESLLWTLGVENMALWLRREKDLINRFIDIFEELCFKTAMAMLDAGVSVILQSDDFAFKSGPFFNPKLIEAYFGPSYRRIIKAIHDRGGKYVLHSCGDNTLLFDMYIDWGVDGLHAYENTSNVDMLGEKKKHGHQIVMIGGMGIDYLLTEHSRDAEVVEGVRQLIKDMAPGGRYILGPSHSMSTIPANKLKTMVDAVNRYGRYSAHDSFHTWKPVSRLSH